MKMVRVGIPRGSPAVGCARGGTSPKPISIDVPLGVETPKVNAPAMVTALSYPRWQPDPKGTGLRAGPGQKGEAAPPGALTPRWRYLRRPAATRAAIFARRRWTLPAFPSPRRSIP